MDRKRVNIFILGSLFLVAAVGAVVFITNDLRKSSNPIVSETNPNQPEPVPTVPVPDLDRPIVITAELSEANKKKAREEIVRAVAALKQDVDLYDDWLNLALYRKMIGDYEAAREIWEYLAVVRPNSGVALHNLANLYAIELRDNQRAEAYYLEAIEREPQLAYVYYATYEFYRYFKKDLVQAKKIIDRAIAAVDPQTASEFQKLRDSF